MSNNSSFSIHLPHLIFFLLLILLTVSCFLNVHSVLSLITGLLSSKDVLHKCFSKVVSNQNISGKMIVLFSNFFSHLLKCRETFFVWRWNGVMGCALHDSLLPVPPSINAAEPGFLSPRAGHCNLASALSARGLPTRMPSLASMS